MTAIARALARMAVAGNPGRLLPILTAGLIAGLLAVVSALSYAALIFSGDLSVFVGPGVGLVLLATLINITVIALMGSLPGTVGGSQDLPTVVMAVMAAGVVQQLSGQVPPQAIFVTVVAAIGVTTLVTGAGLFALGHFRLGRVVRFLPYPVVGGILAGTGWLLGSGGAAMMAGQPPDPSLLQASALLKWLPGAVFACALWWAQDRSSHALVIPGMVLAGTALFYGVMFALGLSMADLSAQGWLLGGFGNEGLLRDWSWGQLAEVQWGSVAGQAVTMATVPVLSAMALLLNASALENAVAREVDLNRELKAAGVANLCAGAAGGLTGYQQLGMSVMSHRAGAASRLTALVAALACGAALLGGASLMSLFPKVVLGGLLMFLGLSFLIDALWKPRHTVPKADQAIVIVILLATALLGFLEAVGVGLAAAVSLFVVHYSKVDVVRQTLSGTSFRSRVLRAPPQREALRQQGDALFALQLQGYLFFGTAWRLLARVRRRLDDPDLPPPQCVLLDFRRVTGVDTTVTLTFDKLLQLARPRRITLVVTEASAAVAAQLRAAGLLAGDGCRLFADLDRGLEWCESRLLDEKPLPLDAPADEPAVQDVLRALELDHASADRLPSHLQRVVLAPGQWLMRRGEAADHLCLLVCGQLTTQLEQPEVSGRKPLRLMTQRGAQVIGEIGFYLGQPRSADVVADVHSVVYRLSREEMKRIEQHDPALASVLHQLTIRLLAGRVMHLTESVSALQN